MDYLLGEFTFGLIKMMLYTSISLILIKSGIWAFSQIKYAR